MSSLQPTKRGWRARIKSNGQDIYLGTFPTKKEADAVEREARQAWPDYRKGEHRSVMYRR